MLDWVLGRVHDTKHGGSVLRIYLWWGIIVRGILIFALLTLLVVRGNFLADWLLTLNVPAVPQANVEELGVISYVMLLVFLTGGAGVRWEVIRRLNLAEAEANSPEGREARD